MVWSDLHEALQSENGRIGEVLGLGYSSVSRRAHIVRERIQKDKVFKKKFKDIKSKIKI